MPNTVNRRDLQTPTVKEEICHYSFQCSAHLSTHPNDLIYFIYSIGPFGNTMPLDAEHVKNTKVCKQLIQ
jgi:hypothetical protein